MGLGLDRAYISHPVVASGAPRFFVVQYNALKCKRCNGFYCLVDSVQAVRPQVDPG
jgi:hypothetical protein